MKSNTEESLKGCENKSEFSAFLDQLLRNYQEIRDNVHSLQKALAGVREQFQDFRAEQTEDNAEVKRQLSELKRNKVWLPRERI